MFELLSTLLKGSNAKAVEVVTDHFAIDLLNQKIREAEGGVNGAKQALATLILRQRAEQTALNLLRSRKAALEDRVRKAIAAGSSDLAMEGAAAIAEMENEEAVRAQTILRLDEKVSRLRHSVEKAHRRVIDLRQGAITAPGHRRRASLAAQPQPLARARQCDRRSRGAHPPRRRAG